MFSTHPIAFSQIRGNNHGGKCGVLGKSGKKYIYAHTWKTCMGRDDPGSTWY